jgi:hypothetical protein
VSTDRRTATGARAQRGYQKTGLTPTGEEPSAHYANGFFIGLNGKSVKTIDIKTGSVSGPARQNTAVKDAALQMQVTDDPKKRASAEALGELPKSRLLSSMRLDEVPDEDVDFLWEPYLAKKMLNVISGPRGSGKTHLALDICARVTTGGNGARNLNR